MFSSLSVTDIVLISVRALVVLAFFAFGWRDIFMLFRRPARNMGTGLNRIWSVGHTTMLEAWAGRIWLLPILWLITTLIMISVLRPFDETERMPLNIRTIFNSQEFLLLLMMWAMANLSLPRERERKIVVTNASKPLSRLEIVLGKITGFSVTAALVLLVMAILSYGILLWQDSAIKQKAAQTYALQQSDFAKASSAHDATALPPSEGMRALSQEGTLFAYNYITAPPGNMTISGLTDFTNTPPVRYLKGGSTEKAIYHFTPHLIASPTASIMPVGQRPFFVFYFPIKAVEGTPLQKLQLRVTAVRSTAHQSSPPIPEEKTILLNENGAGLWEPDDPASLFSVYSPTGEFIDAGEVTVTVNCMTSGVYLQIYDGSPRDPQTGEVPANSSFNVIYYPDRTGAPPPALQPQPADVNPVIQGFERRGRQEVAGIKKSDINNPSAQIPEGAIYRFPGSELANVPIDDKKEFTLSTYMETYKTDFVDKPTLADIQIVSFDLPTDRFRTTIEVAEKRLTQIKVPARYLGNSDPKQRGDLLVLVSCRQPGHSVYLGANDVRIELPRTPFFVNLLKGEFVLLLQAILLITIAVACTVRLGWPVAMLTSGLCWIFGYFVEFIAGLQDLGGLRALNYRTSGMHGMTFQFFDKLTGGIWRGLGAISALVPNFTIYNPSQEYITTLQNIPMHLVLVNLFWTIVFILPVVGIAYLLFRKQELG
jgi:hypothetical protein